MEISISYMFIDRKKLTLTGHTDEVYSVAFSPDGQTLSSASEDQAIILWDAKTGHKKATLKGHTGWGLLSGLFPGRQDPGLGKWR